MSVQATNLVRSHHIETSLSSLAKHCIGSKGVKPWWSTGRHCYQDWTDNAIQMHKRNVLPATPLSMKPSTSLQRGMTCTETPRIIPCFLLSSLESFGATFGSVPSLHSQSRTVAFAPTPAVATFTSLSRKDFAPEKPYSSSSPSSPTLSRGARLAEQSRASASKQSSTQLMYLAALVLAMVGTTYAAVPLYRMFCQATGFGGTVQRRESVEEKVSKLDPNSDVAHAAKEREVVVYFNADLADGMPWRFLPSQRQLRVKPGQSTLAFYTAHNLSDKPITGVSTYNVSPMKSGVYFNKIQCFCFEEQRLRAGEKVDMPVFFYIDPEFATDPKMKDVKSLTLSYTFFKVEDEE